METLREVFLSETQSLYSVHKEYKIIKKSFKVIFSFISEEMFDNNVWNREIN